MTTRRILKWTIPVDDQEHPIGSGKVVHVGCQGGPEAVQVWTDELGEPNLQTMTTARVYGTGQPLPDYGQATEIVGSAITGPLVWHVVRRWPS